MGLRMRQTVLLAKAETTAGVDSIPTGAANSILVRNVDVQPLQVETEERNLVRSFLGNSEAIAVGEQGTISFDVELAGSGTPQTPTGWGLLLRAAGGFQTINGTTSVDYTPATPAQLLAIGSIPTLSIYYNVDGVNHRLLGCRLSAVLNFNAKGIPFIRFTALGLGASIADAALPTGVYTAFRTPVPCNRTNTTFAMFGETALCLNNVSLDLGNELVKRQLITCDTVELVDRQPAGSATIEAPTITDWDWPAAVRNTTLGSFSLTHGVGAGNIIEISAPRVQIIDPAYSDQDGTAMLSLGLRFVPNTGNDEWLIRTR